MWTPPADQVVTDTGWRPPSDQVETAQAQAASPETYPLNPARVAMAAMGAAQNLAPWNKANQILKNDVGGGIASGGGYLAGKVANAGYPNAGNFIQATGVGAAGAVSLAPEVMSAYLGFKGLQNSPSPTVQGLVKTPKELSPQYVAQNSAIGISNDVPETASKIQYENPYQYPSQLTKPKYVNGIAGQVEGAPTIPRLKPQVPAEPLPSTVPLKYPNDPGTLINHINDTIDLHGTNLNPQQLADYKELLSTKMANGEIPKFGPDGKITPIFAKATQTAQKVTATLNQVAEPLLAQAQQAGKLPQGVLPTRAGLNQAYGVANKQQAYVDFLKRVPVYAGEAGGGLYMLKKALGYVTGNH